MTKDSSFIGFGEAAQTFSRAPNWRGRMRAFDAKTNCDDARATKLNDYQAHGTKGCLSLLDALTGADAVLSLVTADQSLAAAQNAAQHIERGALYLDMNSSAPERKRAAAALIEDAGAHYVDVAIMAPVQPLALAVPINISGPAADDAKRVLLDLGFTTVKIIGDRIGDASTIKMVRSVMIKGIEALTAECLLAAKIAGVENDVLASLGGDWTERANYNLERMLVHGARRAAEMEEACATLESLGVDPALSRGTVERQRALGKIGDGRAPDDLAEKLKLMMQTQKQDTA